MGIFSRKKKPKPTALPAKKEELAVDGTTKKPVRRTFIDDWIKDRDDKTFTKTSKKHRSGWDKGFKSSSGFLLSGRSWGGFVGGWGRAEKRLQFEEIKGLCKSRVSVMSPSDRRIQLIFHPSSSMTDGNFVLVSSEVFDHAVYDFEQKSDTMLGLTTHEMAHVLYTKFPLCAGLTPFEKTIENIIEDERIEMIIGEEYPGYVICLSAAKEYYFNEKYLLDSDQHPTNEFEEIWDCFFKSIRYPAYLSEDLEKKHSTVLKEIRNLLTPYPETFEEVILVSKKIADILKKYMDEEQMKSLVESMGGGCGGEGEDGDGSGSGGGLVAVISPTTGKRCMMSKAAKEIIDKLTPAQKAKLKEALEKAIEKIAAEMRGLESTSTRSEKDKAEAELSTIARLGGIPESALEMSEVVENDGSKIDMEEDYGEVYDADTETFFDRVDPHTIDMHAYDEAKREIRSDARRLAQTLYVKMFSERKILHGFRNGKLDDNKIVEAVHGIRTVYTNVIEREVKRIDMVLLIDESGSMGTASSPSSKSRQAMKVAMIFEEAFNTFPQGELFIYGFTSEHLGYTNYVKRYREPGVRERKGLGAVNGLQQNRDGDCIRAVAKRVRKFTNNRMLYFIISDGQPCSPKYGGKTGIEHTREAVVEVTKMGFFPVQIGIETDERYQKMMFTEYVNYKESKQMVDDVRKLFLKKARHLANV